jgi:hypothetical protein
VARELLRQHSAFPKTAGPMISKKTDSDLLSVIDVSSVLLFNV